MKISIIRVISNLACNLHADSSWREGRYFQQWRRVDIRDRERSRYFQLATVFPFLHWWVLGNRLAVSTTRGPDYWSGYRAFIIPVIVWIRIIRIRSKDSAGADVDEKEKQDICAQCTFFVLAKRTEHQLVLTGHHEATLWFFCTLIHTAG